MWNNVHSRLPCYKFLSVMEVGYCWCNWMISSILADELYVGEKMMSILEVSFMVSWQWLQELVVLFLLQLEHVVETNYESATVVTKIENIQQTYQQYCKFGTVPKAHKTPGTSHTST